MPFEDYKLTEGVTYEVLPENDFTKQIPSYTNGFIRLHPYNQVMKCIPKISWIRAMLLQTDNNASVKNHVYVAMF